MSDDRLARLRSSFIVHRSSFVAAVVALCLASGAFALGIPPKPTAWVTDNGDILAPEQEQALNEKLEALKKQTGAEFLIMNFPSLEGEDVGDYSNRVADQWKVKGDRALLLLVFVRDHKVGIRTGYGLESVITDAYSSRVIRETIAPYFRQQQYYEGLDAAVSQLAQKIDPNFSPQSRSLPSSPPRQRASGSSQLGGRDILFLLFLVFIFLVVIGPMMRRRGCGGCWPLFFFPGGGGGTTFGGGGGGGGGWSVGGSWGGGGSSFGGGGATGGW